MNGASSLKRKSKKKQIQDEKDSTSLQSFNQGSILIDLKLMTPMISSETKHRIAYNRRISTIKEKEYHSNDRADQTQTFEQYYIKVSYLEKRMSNCSHISRSIKRIINVESLNPI